MKNRTCLLYELLKLIKFSKIKMSLIYHHNCFDPEHQSVQMWKKQLDVIQEKNLPQNLG